MKFRNIMSFIAFGVMIAIGFWYVGAQGVQTGVPSNRTDATMAVADVNGLVVGSKVLLRGVPVGEVRAIDTSAEAANVHFYIREPYRVPSDAEVRLENLSALGESYISLMPRSAGGPALRNGEQISADSITQPASVSELATSVTRVLNQFDPVALGRIIGEADAALPDPGTVLPNLSRTSMLLRNTAADMNGRGQGVLENLQTLLQNAGWVGPVMGTLSAQLYHFAPHLSDLFATFLPIIAQGGAPESLHRVGTFMDRIQKFLDTNGGDMRVIGDNFGPHLTGIAGSMLNFDTGQILTNLLDNLPSDGVVPLYVSLTDNQGP